MSKYRTHQARLQVNRLVKSIHKITCSAQIWRDWLKCVHDTTGKRELELKAYETKSGHTELVQF